MTSSPIRVLIVDDHTLFREGLIAILANSIDIEVVGEAATGAEALGLVAACTPDVILMDITMPGMSGIDAAREILNSSTGVGIIILTMLEDDESLFAAMRAGVRGYLLKGAVKADVLRTIRTVADGEALFGPGVANRITRFFQTTSVGEQTDRVALPALTDREREVLNLVACGANNSEIALTLHISGKTVSNHVSSIFNKLQVADRMQAIVKARKAGLGDA
jgi:DNA-binding NarL/FixJ family response regulator